MHAERISRVHHRRERLDLQQPVQRLLQVDGHGDALAELALQIVHMHGVGGLLQRGHCGARAVHLPRHELVRRAAEGEAVGVAAADGILRAAAGGSLAV